MKVTYSEQVRKQEKDFQRLQQATSFLEEIIGSSAGLVEAEWDRSEDERGRPLYTLRISDWTGTASAEVTPEDLAIPTHLHLLLYLLWGDLLQVRNHKQLEALQAAGDAEG